MEEERCTPCPSCGQPVDPNEPGVKYTFKLEQQTTMRGYEHVDGMGAYFHEACYIPTGYRKAPNP